MKILLLGDSHVNQFAGRGKYFDLGGEVLTGQRLVDYYEPIAARLDSWLAVEGSGAYLLVSLNEVDIRGHYWRHIPRGADVVQYVEERVAAFHNRLEKMIQEYGLARIVLWGAPPAGLNITNNPHWPFVGPTATRNRIIDLFNRKFAERCRSKGSIVFATGFYQYIDPVSYEPLGHIPSDGVHWSSSLTEEFWNTLIVPAMHGDQRPTPPGPEFTFGSQTVHNLDQYDSWIRVDSAGEYEHTAEHLGQLWALVSQALVPAERIELILVNR